MCFRPLTVRLSDWPKHAPFASFCRGTRRLRFPADPRCLDTDIQVICRTRPRAGPSTDRIVAGAWNDSGNRLSRDDAVEQCGRAKFFRSRWSGRLAPCVRRWPWADTATQSRGRGTQNRVARAPGVCLALEGRCHNETGGLCLKTLETLTNSSNGKRHCYRLTGLTRSDLTRDMALLWSVFIDHIIAEREHGSWHRLIFECWVVDGYLIAYPHMRGDSPERSSARSFS